MTYELSLEAAWPGVVPVARRELYGFRLSPETVEDLVQEAAAVVLRKRPVFEGPDDLAPYVRIVVRRLALHWLRDNRREAVGTVPDRPVLHGVPDVVESRMRLAGTVHAFNTLEPGQRALLSDYIADRSAKRERAEDRRASARERKQVQRLRMAMARVADGFAAALGWLRLRFRFLEPLSMPLLAVGMATTALLELLVPSPGGAAGPAVEAGAPPQIRLPDALVMPVKESATAIPRGSAPDQRPQPRVEPEPTQPPVPVARQSEDVIRVDSPMGATGWRTTPSTRNDPLVCLSGPVVGAMCTPEKVLP